MSFFSRRKNLLDRILFLEEENAALNLLVTDAAELRKKHTREVERWQRQISDLNAELDTKDAFNRALNRAFDQKQAELERAIAEVKRLDGKLVQVDCENLRLNGLLSTAEEQLAAERVKA